MATNNSVNAPLSGNTGTGHFVGSTSPTLITPVLGAATATSVAFSPTTGGLIGTTAADNASAGTVGEFISSNISNASAINYTTTTVNQNLTSITLSAGDWDVWGNIYYIPAPTTVIQGGIAGISAISATLPDPSFWAEIFPAAVANQPFGLVAPMQRMNVSGSTIVYIVGDLEFTVSTVKFCGGIYARRVR